MPLRCRVDVIHEINGVNLIPRFDQIRSDQNRQTRADLLDSAMKVTGSGRPRFGPLVAIHNGIVTGQNSALVQWRGSPLLWVVARADIRACSARTLFAACLLLLSAPARGAEL